MNTALQMTRQAKSTLVLGLGKTGYSVVAHLSARGGKITAADTRDPAPCLDLVRERYPQVEVISGSLPLDSLGQFDRIVVSPGLAVASDLRLIGDIELFVESATAPIIAITGSNGKSTVTTLVAEMLAAAGKRALIGGNIGTPALELLAQPTPDFYVLELSSFQLENTYSLSAAAAAILNISEDHLDRYPDIDQYAAAKARILRRAAVRVLNRDDPASHALLQANPAALSFGLGRPAGADEYGVTTTPEGRFFCRGESRLAPVEGMVMQGEHNIANILAAAALVEAAGTPVTRPVLGAALACRGLAHRCEPVAQGSGVQWINDSKATNVGATIAAIRGFGDDLILIAGGRGKGADFSSLQAPVAQRVRHAVLFGEDAERIAAAIATATEIHRADDLQHAVSIAADCARAGQVVLFSPACASFDMFENYAERGRAFKRLVAELEASQ